MRKDIDHLPARTRYYLDYAVQVLRREFALALRRKKRTADKPRRILKIVLFGSMARGKPVRDVNTGYVSDYDLLVIVSEPELTDMRYWEGASDALQLEEAQGSRTRHPVSFIVHDLDDVNRQLYLGRPFFRDIYRDGIVVYEFNKRELTRPGNLSPEEELAEARMYFEQWFPKIAAALRGAARYIEDGELNDAAFTLHQAVERAYHCALLTLTLYSPKLHNLNELRRIAEGIEPRLIEAWPRRTYYHRRPFNRLVRAYVEARYSPNYVITKEDLTAATDQIARLQALVKQACEERLGPA